MTATVANLKKTKSGIRCDRASALGNPFALRNEAERPAVVEGYRRYFWLVVRHGWEPVVAAARVAAELNLAIASTWRRPSHDLLTRTLAILEAEESPVLLCWCHPLPCHCDPIAKYLNLREKPTAEIIQTSIF